MTNALTTITSTFEGHALITLTYKGRPCWIAKQVGLVFGYGEDGAKLRGLVRDKWAGDFLEGTDFFVVEGEELTSLRAGFASTPGVPANAAISTKTRSLVLLTESGLYLVLSRTEKEVGRRFRRWLADEVMPQISRTGSYTPAPHTPPQETLTAKERMALDRERRLGDRERRLLEQERRYDRKQRGDAYKWLLEQLGASISPDARTELQCRSVEATTGDDLKSIKPRFVGDDWKTATEIGESLGVSAQVIGRIRKALGLEGNQKGLCKTIITKAAHSDKQVPQVLYSPKAEGMIREKLVEDGKIPQA